MKQTTLIRIIIFLIILNIAGFGYLQYQPLKLNTNPKTLQQVEDSSLVLASANSSLNPEFDTGIDIQEFIPPFRKINNSQNAGDMAGTQDIEITAQSAMLKDVTTGKILFEKNNNQQMPIASLTKIMTALIILENLELDQVIEISQQAIQAQGNAGNLMLGEKFRADDLLNIMLIESSNDAAQAFGEVMPNLIDLMNKKSEQIGLQNTRFTDAHGLDSNNVSTADDIIKLAEYSFDNQIWKILSQKQKTVYSLDQKPHYLESTNKLLREMPEIISGKTGYTEEAGQTLIILAKAPNNDILVSALLNSEDRFADMQKIIKWCFENYSWSP